MRNLLLLTSVYFIFSLTTACAPIKERFFWPLPPDQPKLEHIGVYSSSQDMTTGKGGAIAEALVGGTTKPLRQPTAVAADSRGIVYVSDTVNNMVMVFDFAKKTMEPYNNIGFMVPFGLDVDNKDNLYVVERKGAIVRVFTPEREPLLSFGGGILQEPIRIAVDNERGRIYVSDRADHLVKVFSLEGVHIQSIGGSNGKRSSADGEFNSPNDVEVDSVGNLYVCDQLNARIQIFDPNGTYVRKFGVRGDQIFNFEGPTGIAIDSSGKLWIADIRKAAIITYENSTPPQLLMLTFGAAASDGQYSFKSPMDIFIDKKNRIYVADSLALRISIWQILDEPYLLKNPVPANWIERTDVKDIWYRDSGLKPPEKDAKTPKPTP